MSLKPVRGKSVLITGAVGGMGLEFARQFLALGADLILAGRDEGKTAGAAETLASGPGRVLGVIGADLSSPEGCQLLFERSRKLAPDLDILINNAGLINYGYSWEIPACEWQKLMAVNLLAPMRLSQLVVPAMLERGSGHLVFMCSVAGFAATSLSTPYAASKFGLRGFAMALSGEIAKRGLKVTIVYPAWVRTGMLDSPVHGSAALGKIPPLLAGDPALVVREAVRGIRRDKLHVCPGRFAKLVWLAAKAWPIVSGQVR